MLEVYEEPIIPVFVDREQEVQAYYGRIEALTSESYSDPQSLPYSSFSYPGAHGSPAWSNWQNYPEYQPQPYPHQPSSNYPTGSGYPDQSMTGHANAPYQPGFTRPYSNNHSHNFTTNYGYVENQNRYPSACAWQGVNQPYPAHPAPSNEMPRISHGGQPPPWPHQAMIPPALWPPNYPIPHQAGLVDSQNPSSQPAIPARLPYYAMPHQSGLVDSQNSFSQPTVPTKYSGWEEAMFSSATSWDHRPVTGFTSSLETRGQTVDETVTVSQVFRAPDELTTSFQGIDIGWKF